MGNFNRENSQGRNRSFGKNRFNTDRPDMHKATCAKCGKICEVPFRPTGSKPVFCRDCFQQNEGSNSGRSETRSFGRPNSEDRQMYDAVCSNCGNNCQIPFRPSPGREIFCSRCFENNEGSESRRPERRTFDKPSFKSNDVPNYKAQFEALNAKMDKILYLLTPKEVAPLESAINEKVIEEIAEKVKEDSMETVEKKPKKIKALSTKPATKTKNVL
jgi:CxxC-x17-CxxC domain-containing protein